MYTGICEDQQTNQNICVIKQFILNAILKRLSVEKVRVDRIAANRFLREVNSLVRLVKRSHVVLIFRV